MDEEATATKALRSNRAYNDVIPPSRWTGADDGETNALADVRRTNEETMDNSFIVFVLFAFVLFFFQCAFLNKNGGGRGGGRRGGGVG